MRSRVPVLLLLFGSVACSAAPGSTSNSGSEQPDERPPAGEGSELTAVLSGIVGSHQLSLAHEVETRATRSPNLQAIFMGAAQPAVDEDVVRRLPSCVAIEKSFDLPTQTYEFVADFSGCSEGRASCGAPRW